MDHRLDAVGRIRHAARPRAAGFELLAKLAMVLIFAGLCFRVTAVPFHFYAPDVYQGTTHANAALLSVVPKAAGLVALVRLVVLAMPDMGPYAWKIVLVALGADDDAGQRAGPLAGQLRRLLAYSSIANAGYMLIGLAVGLAPGTRERPVGRHRRPCSSTSACTRRPRSARLPSWPTWAASGSRSRPSTNWPAWAAPGPSWPPRWPCACSAWRPAAAAGFWGKLLVFGSALNVQDAGGVPLRPWFIALAVIGVLNAAVAAYYYLRIVA